MKNVQRDQTIEFIQVLRGLAAFAVVISHASWEHTNYGTDNRIQQALNSGIAGVDLFFVISGFIMYCTIPIDAGGWREASRFAIKRFSRIWPPYAAWTLVLTLFIASLPAGKLAEHPAHWADLVRSLLFLPTSQIFYPPAFTVPVLAVGWTLYYEAYFYAVLTLCLCFGRWKWLVFMCWLMLAIVATPLMRGAPMIDPNVYLGNSSPLLNTLSSPIMWEFAAGIAIGWIYRRGIRFPHFSIGIIANLLAVAFLIFYCVSAKQILHGLSEVGLPITLIVLTLALTPAKSLHAWKPLLALGKISFSLYLAHMLVILAMDTSFSIRMVALSPPLLVAFITFACVLSILVASFSYRILEAGLSNWIRDRILACAPWHLRQLAVARLDDQAIRSSQDGI